MLEPYINDVFKDLDLSNIVSIDYMILNDKIKTDHDFVCKLIFDIVNDLPIQLYHESIKNHFFDKYFPIDPSKDERQPNVHLIETEILDRKIVYLEKLRIFYS